MRVDRAADVLFACGAPESGKSYRIHQALEERSPDRLVLIDPDGEYDRWGYLHTDPRDVGRALCYATYRTRFKPSAARAVAEQQFDFICRLVRWQTDPQPGQAAPARVGPVCLVVDELADLVGPSFRETPDSWQWVIKRGRKYGVSVLAASQRPEQIDKTIFSLCSCIRVGRLNDADGVRRLANAINVPAAELFGLVGIEYLERDKRTGALTRGPAKVAAKAAAARAASSSSAPAKAKKRASRSIDRS